MIGWSTISSQETSILLREIFMVIQPIINCFIKTLFNGYICSDSERLLFSLPAKFGGLGIFAPTERSRIEYENSRHITAEMIENVKNQVSNYDSKNWSKTEHRHEPFEKLKNENAMKKP